MDRQDRDRLITLAYIAILIVFSLAVVKGAKNIKNVIMPCVFLLAVQQLYVIPEFVKKYMEIYNEEVGIIRFIPIYGETKVMAPAYAKGYMISFALFVISALVVLTPPSKLPGFVPQNIALELSNRAIYFMVLFFVTTCVVRGIGYCKVIYDIEDCNEDSTGITKDKWDYVNVISYATVFIPGIRTLGLIFQLSMLTKLVDFDEYTYDYYEE